MKAGLFPYKSKALIKVQGRVAILGARGMDAARAALRLGAEEVCMFYQRKVVGRVDDIRQGIEEGVRLQPLTRPLRLIGDERRWVKLVELIKLKPGAPGKMGNKSLSRSKAQSSSTALKQLSLQRDTPRTRSLRRTP